MLLGNEVDGFGLGGVGLVLLLPAHCLCAWFCDLQDRLRGPFTMQLPPCASPACFYLAVHLHLLSVALPTSRPGSSAKSPSQLPNQPAAVLPPPRPGSCLEWSPAPVL